MTKNVMPWEPYKSISKYRTFSGYYNMKEFTCLRTYEHIPDSESQVWRKGDVVRFENGITWGFNQDIWQEWFLTDENYINFLKNSEVREKKLPLYAARHYAIIIGKYRIVKKKLYGNFMDYGAIILMLTGSRIGHHRKYFVYFPVRKVSNYPHIKVPKELSQFSDILLSFKEDTENSRNKLVSEIYKKAKEC